MKQHSVVELIAEHLGVDPSKVQLSANLEKDLGADSLDTADLFLAVKETYGVRISKDDIESIKTVADLMEKIEGKS